MKNVLLKKDETLVADLIRAFESAGISGHLEYNPRERRLQVKRAKYLIDPSIFVDVFNRFYDDHKREIKELHSAEELRYSKIISGTLC